MVLAKVGDTVLVHYSAKLDDGTVVESSLERAPITVRIGAGKAIPGLEQALIGMQPGESKTQAISSCQAYGPYRPEKVLTVNRKRVFADADVEIGQKMERTSPDGETLILTVISVDKSRVTLDANHSLAGKDLTYEIEFLKFAKKSTPVS